MFFVSASIFLSPIWLCVRFLARRLFVPALSLLLLFDFPLKPARKAQIRPDFVFRPRPGQAQIATGHLKLTSVISDWYMRAGWFVCSAGAVGSVLSHVRDVRAPRRLIQGKFGGEKEFFPMATIRDWPLEELEFQWPVWTFYPQFRFSKWNPGLRWRVRIPVEAGNWDNLESIFGLQFCAHTRWRGNLIGKRILFPNDSDVPNVL